VIKDTYIKLYNSFQRGQRCPICDRIKTSSKGEKEVFELAKQYTNDQILENDRTQILNPLTGWNLELDIYMPSLNKAIEYNGEYWHSSPYAIEKDTIKQEQCKEKGIELLIIEERNWIDNKNSCIELLKDFIND